MTTTTKRKRLTAYQKRVIPWRLAELLIPRRCADNSQEIVAKILTSLPDSALQKLWDLSRSPGSPMLAQRQKDEEKIGSAKARKILLEGLKYYEHDGHDMPKRVARNALIALGVQEEDQP